MCLDEQGMWYNNRGQVTEAVVSGAHYQMLMEVGQ
jgi:hypothetical protein